jgi:hypothetical protein
LSSSLEAVAPKVEVLPREVGDANVVSVTVVEPIEVKAVAVETKAALASPPREPRVRLAEPVERDVPIVKPDPDFESPDALAEARRIIAGSRDNGAPF